MAPFLRLAGGWRLVYRFRRFLTVAHWPIAGVSAFGQTRSQEDGCAGADRWTGKQTHVPIRRMPMFEVGLLAPWVFAGLPHSSDVCLGPSIYIGLSGNPTQRCRGSAIMLCRCQRSLPAWFERRDPCPTGRRSSCWACRVPVKAWCPCTRFGFFRSLGLARCYNPSSDCVVR